MAKYLVNLLANTTKTFLCNIYNPKRYSPWKGTLAVQGSAFGGGTVTFYVSYDQGTTLIPIKDLTDTAVVFTANGSLNVEHGVARDKASNNLLSGNIRPNAPQLYCGLTGATSPNINVLVYDIN